MIRKERSVTFSKRAQEEVVIPRIEELHRVLAHTLIHLPGRLRAEEIRFLRKLLGWSGPNVAMRLGVTAENVSRWENGWKRISAIADRLLRLCVADACSC